MMQPYTIYSFFFYNIIEICHLHGLQHFYKFVIHLLTIYIYTLYNSYIKSAFTHCQHYVYILQHSYKSIMHIYTQHSLHHIHNMQVTCSLHLYTVYIIYMAFNIDHQRMPNSLQHTNNNKQPELIIHSLRHS